MAQNEMKAKPALPERVRSMEGLGVARAVKPMPLILRLARERLRDSRSNGTSMVHIAFVSVVIE